MSRASDLRRFRGVVQEIAATEAALARLRQEERELTRRLSSEEPVKSAPRESKREPEPPPLFTNSNGTGRQYAGQASIREAAETVAKSPAGMNRDGLATALSITQAAAFNRLRRAVEAGFLVKDPKRRGNYIAAKEEK